MIISRKDIENYDKYFRISLINQLSGIKSAHLIGSVSSNGESNLAIFNSVCHIGASPAAMGFLLRPLTVERHTYSNIMETAKYTINHVRQEFLHEAHLTSAKYPKGQSEFQALGFTEEYIDGFSAPFVAESHVKIGLSFEEKHEIAMNGTVFMVGMIDYISISDDLVESTGHIDFGKTDGAAVSGLDTYYSYEKLERKAFARVPK